MSDSGEMAAKIEAPRPPRTLYRWLANLALLYAVILGVGLLMGVLGAVGEDRINQGVDATITYVNDRGQATHTEVQGTDPTPGLLLFFPAMALIVGTAAVVPVVAVALLIAELACRVGVPPGLLRGIGIAFPALLVLNQLACGRWAGVELFPLLGLLVYALIVRLPAGRVT